MITSENIEGYWEFYEIPISKERLDSVLNVFSDFEKTIEDKLNLNNIKRVKNFHYSPHSIIRIMQSNITLMELKTNLEYVLSAHIYNINGKLKYGRFIGPFRILKGALNRVELKSKDFFIVFKTRNEPKIFNRLDIISAGEPGVRPRNSKKPEGWGLMTNEEKKNILLKFK